MGTGKGKGKTVKTACRTGNGSRDVLQQYHNQDLESFNMRKYPFRQSSRRIACCRTRGFRGAPAGIRTNKNSAAALLQKFWRQSAMPPKPGPCTKYSVVLYSTTALVDETNKSTTADDGTGDGSEAVLGQSKECMLICCWTGHVYSGRFDFIRRLQGLSSWYLQSA